MGSNHWQGDARPALAGRTFRHHGAARNAITVACLASALAHATPTHAQLAARDSLRYLADAHRAQAEFERYRREHLPRSQPSDVKPCDVKIGRFCYWHSPDDAPVVESRQIVAARERLLRRLDALSQLSRADEWIVGQRVHYLVEAGYDSSAIVASRECWSAKWWCDVLRGYALHAAQRYEEAEAILDSALATMPAPERCRWSDISLLVTDDDRAYYTKLPCGSSERNEFERRFWQLADPSYLVAGNDRRTEHFARMLLVTLASTAQNAYGLSWGDDLRELTIRYGTPLTYSTTWGSWPSFDAPLIGHEREPSYHFAALDARSDVARWDVRAEQARERYAPAYIDSLADLDAQFGMFKRGDSALVIAVFANAPRNNVTEPMHEHPSGSAERIHTALGVTDSNSVAVSMNDSMGTTRVRTVRAAWKGVVVGIEQYDPGARRAHRVRRWLAPPRAYDGGPQMSTLLFYDGGDTSAVVSLQDAIRRAMTSDDLRKTRKVGVYWEVYTSFADSHRNDSTPRDSAHIYSEEPDSAMAVSLTVTRMDGGFLKWLAQTLRVSPRDSPLAIAWHDVPGADGLSYRSVTLDLAQLPAGTYRVDLAVGPENARRTITSRELRLR